MDGPTRSGIRYAHSLMLNVLCLDYIYFIGEILVILYIPDIFKEMKNMDNDLGIFATGQTSKNLTPGAKQGILSRKMPWKRESTA